MPKPNDEYTDTLRKSFTIASIPLVAFAKDWPLSTGVRTEDVGNLSEVGYLLEKDGATGQNWYHEHPEMTYNERNPPFLSLRFFPPQRCSNQASSSL